MEKLDMQSMNVTATNVEKIAALFPSCVTERLNSKGVQELAIDFDKLRMELGADVLDETEERYQFTWPDKREAIRLSNARTTMTLRPCREESVDFDNTENLYIEGDNLEVLKVLQQNYLGKIKMIYIDPPYNTGGDFIYNDKRVIGADEYKNNSGQYDAEGNQLVKNTESNGRFHTDWLNFMYPRLKVARNLLSNDGIIFISIDDNEVENLKKICDEIFGSTNFIDIYNWTKTETPENLSIKCRQMIEYVLCYQKHKDNTRFKGLKKFSSSSNGLLNQPNALGILEFPANTVITKIPDGKINAGIYGTDKYDVELLDDVLISKGLFANKFRLKAKFKWQQTYLENEIRNGTIISIPTIKFSPSYEKKEYAPEVPTNLINNKVNVDTNENAGEYQLQLFSKKVFNFPKPTSLMQYLFGFLDNPNESYVVLDFFSGSASTAESVMKMNCERKANHVKYIMVQLQEDLDKAKAKTTSASQKEITQNAIDLCDELQVPHVLTEVAKERIRRAGKKIKEDNSIVDTGFRVLKLAESNMKDVYYTPGEVQEQDIWDSLSNIKEDRTPEDLLFQVMPECGVKFSEKIEVLEISGKKVFSVMDNYLAACFDENVNEEVITAIAKTYPTYFVMRDNSLESDNVADNFMQIFKQYSPETTCKII